MAMALDIEQIDLLALASADVRLRLVSRRGRRGPEWVGPCPVCRTGDDRFHVWSAPPAKRPNYWCRVCDATGDALSYVRWTGRAASFSDALVYLGLPTTQRVIAASRLAPRPPAPCTPPNDIWQERAWQLVKQACEELWCAGGVVAREWLAQRGLNSTTIARARLGWLPASGGEEREAWGLESGDRSRSSFFVPSGVVIPYMCDGIIWRVEVRRIVPGLHPKQKYRTLPGSSNALFNADALQANQPAVLVEGAFDALAVAQTAGDLVATVASGTSGARGLPWLARLARCRPVLVALDADPGPEKGDRASAWWIDTLQPTAYRWRPLIDDPASMLAKGLDVRDWVAAGLRAASHHNLGASQC